MPQAPGPAAASEPKLSAFILMILTLLFVFGLLSHIGQIDDRSKRSAGGNGQGTQISSMIGDGRSIVEHITERHVSPTAEGQPSFVSAQGVQDHASASSAAGRFVTDGVVSGSPQDASAPVIADNMLLDTLRETGDLDDPDNLDNSAEETRNVDASSTEETPVVNRVNLPQRDRKEDRLGPGPQFASNLPVQKNDIAPKAAPDRIPQYRDVNRVASKKDVFKKQYHTVCSGETLWKIATKHYKNGNAWRKIAAANKGVNPDRIRPGMKLLIPENASILIAGGDAGL